MFYTTIIKKGSKPRLRPYTDPRTYLEYLTDSAVWRRQQDVRILNGGGGFDAFLKPECLPEKRVPPPAAVFHRCVLANLSRIGRLSGDPCCR